MNKDDDKRDFTISIQVKSKTIDINCISDVIELIPSISWSVGDTLSYSSIKDGRRQQNYRCFDISVDCSQSIEQNMMVYLDRLEGSRDYIDSLWRDDGLISFYITWYANRVRGHVFKSSFLRKLADLQIELGVEILVNSIDNHGD